MGYIINVFFLFFYLFQNILYKRFLFFTNVFNPPLSGVLPSSYMWDLA